MMKRKHILWLVFFGFFSGFIVGSNLALWLVRSQAVEHNVGEWRMECGKERFKWLGRPDDE